MKKAGIALLLFALLVCALSGCGAQKSMLETYEWSMNSIMSTNGDFIVMEAVSEANDAYPAAPVLDMVLTAKNGMLSLTDKTNGRSYSGTYQLTDQSVECDIYSITLNGKSGYAACTMTKYNDGSEKATLTADLGNYSLYFFVK